MTAENRCPFTPVFELDCKRHDVVRRSRCPLHRLVRWPISTVHCDATGQLCNWLYTLRPHFTTGCSSSTKDMCMKPAAKYADTSYMPGWRTIRSGSGGGNVSFEN